jgi:hypothetical protein
MMRAPGNSARIALIASIPPISGICKSISVMSGRCFRNCSSASRPLEASATSSISVDFRSTRRHLPEKRMVIYRLSAFTEAGLVLTAIREFSCGAKSTRLSAESGHIRSLKISISSKESAGTDTSFISMQKSLPPHVGSKGEISALYSRNGPRCRSYIGSVFAPKY